MGFFQFGSLFIFVGQKLTKMTKADIVKQLAQETGIEAATVSVVVEEFMEQVRGTVIAGEHVYLRGFGAFIRKHRREKTARNISKNVTIRIPAHDIPAFKTLSRLPAAFRKEMIATTPRFGCSNRGVAVLSLPVTRQAFRRAWSARNFSSPLSVSGCLSSPSIAARGHVATSAPASRHWIICCV